jgi:hypothetical protein
VLHINVAPQGWGREEEEGLFFFLSQIGGMERLKNIPETIQSVYDLMRAQDRNLIFKNVSIELETRFP